MINHCRLTLHLSYTLGDMVRFLFLVILALSVPFAKANNAQRSWVVGGFPPPPPCKSCAWTDAKTLDVKGRANFPSFGKRDSYFDRLPSDAQGKVRNEVWSLSRMSAGMYIDFSTSSSQLYLNITYTTEVMSMWHFPATGCSGMDLYAWDSANETWRWTSVTKIMQCVKSKTGFSN